MIAVTRAFLCLFAAGAFVWGCSNFSIFWEQSTIEQVSSHIVSGFPYKIGALTNLKPTIASAERLSLCRPAGSRSAAIIRARIAEETIANGDTDHIDLELSSFHRSLMDALLCSPRDSYLWLLMFGAENFRNGFKPENLRYLRLSYGLGANEGWIALKRNVAAFSMYEGLDSDLSERAITEFVQLLSTGLYGEVVDIFVGPAWQSRAAILPRLASVPLRQREIFAEILRNRSIDIDVPGVVIKRH